MEEDLTMNQNGAMTTNEILFALLRSEMCGNLSQNIAEHLSIEVLQDLYKISNAHDLGHIVSNSLHKLGRLGNDEISQKFVKKQMMAIYRCKQLKHTLSEICAVFEKERIPYIPLKGSILRSYYQEEWMRTSCDIDILVHEEDLNRAVVALTSTGGYKAADKVNYHDISLFSRTGVHLELHFNIKEDMENIDHLLSMVWDYSKKDNNSYCYSQANEYFIFHHIAHMSYHFVHGGCGIKPFIDLYIIKNKMKYDDEIVRGYCRQCGIDEFYNNMLYITDVWFGDKMHTSISRQIEEYILRGGVYGTLENKVVVAQSKHGGKGKYIVSRLFMPFDSLKRLYPIIERHKWLYPFMQIRRWFAVIFNGDAKRVVRELSYNSNISTTKADSMKIFLSEIGL